jgi:hypothetical protein
MVEQNDAIIKQNDRILQIKESCDVIEEVIDKLDSSMTISKPICRPVQAMVETRYLHQ